MQNTLSLQVESKKGCQKKSIIGVLATNIWLHFKNRASKAESTTKMKQVYKITSLYF